MLAPAYNYGPVVNHNPKVLVVTMGWHGDPSAELPEVQAFLRGLGTGADHWSKVVATYPHVVYPHHVYLGTWHDTKTFPVRATLANFNAEANRATAKFPKIKNLIVVLLPPPTSTLQQIDNACAFHSYATYGPYVALGYGANTGGCPNTDIQLSHEWAETLTDPDPVAPGWVAGDGNEVADVCQTLPAGAVRFTTGTFSVAAVWNHKTKRCATRA